ncbi:MAG: rod shape-determining protein MreC [Deltaproteobacteria bacterium]|nr:rod shape-determining protein MreC [Deltaproteobacteria bacterium]
MSKLKRRKRRLRLSPYFLPLFLSFFSLLILFAPHVRKYTLFPIVDRGVLSLTSPLQTLSSGTIVLAQQWVSDYLLSIRDHREMDRLEEENKVLRSQLQRLREISLENLRLRQILSFQADTGFSAIPAKVIGHGFSGKTAVLRINKGETDGVHVHSAVITSEGVVGQVWAVQPHSSEVLTIADQGFSADARIGRSRAWGILEGVSRTLSSMNYVRKSESIEMGDEVLTSGLDGIYPRGLLLGTVYEVQQDPNMISPKILVQPAVAVTKLEEVLVMAGAPR